MVRLICFLLIFALFLVFIVLNLDNNCDINFGFYQLEKAPVSVTALASFFLGMLFTVPVALIARGKKQPKEPKQKKEKPEKKKKSSGTYQDETSKDNGPYGID